MPAPIARALVLRAAGTNCDTEMARAFERAGASAQTLHLERLVAEPALIDGFDLLGFPGGFSFGDDIASGRIFAMKLRRSLYPALRAAALRGVPMIAACNGFQIITQAGLLPGPAAGEPWPTDAPPAQEVTLTFNAGGRFIDRWCRVLPDPASPCIWTRGLAERFGPDTLTLPIAHGEGRFVAATEDTLQRLAAAGQIALRYAPADNPNGSTADIAGICDASGRIFGLMPHPERYLDWSRHPYWTRLAPDARAGDPPGLLMFRNAVEAAAAVSAR